LIRGQRSTAVEARLISGAPNYEALYNASCQDTTIRAEFPGVLAACTALH
jgi:hypothetical protein